MQKSKNGEKNAGKAATGQSQNPPPEPVSSIPPGSQVSQWVAWLVSPTVRHATAMWKHVHKLLNHQCDVLSRQAIQSIEAGISELRNAIARNESREALEKQMESLEQVANKWLKPYPNAAWRENIEVLLVALTVAMGIRTFFLQPFKIPTGSMQPTLFGVTSTPDVPHMFESAQDRKAESLVIPQGWER